ncbi:oligopeptide transport system substrate-binding protein [Izhakiella capsodis]|uniref:Oligopeptide transport system substrate-binding protein n=2 Tax=Izhakiella capsodis TaxID=1367852 RepID=A0A1I4Z7V6_9GAMM|nr:oligopeptide transport system substrate-binding protein [Izhakiella capsodis]
MKDTCGGNEIADIKTEDEICPGCQDLSHSTFFGAVSSDEQVHPIPGVAESSENSGGKIWIFNLRPNAKWSNGQPVNAASFV